MTLLNDVNVQNINASLLSLNNMIKNLNHNLNKEEKIIESNCDCSEKSSIDVDVVNHVLVFSEE